MIPKNNDRELKKEIEFNENMEKKLNELVPNVIYDVHYKTLADNKDKEHLEWVPSDDTSENIKWFNPVYKKWTILVLAVVTTIIILALILSRPLIDGNEIYANYERSERVNGHNISHSGVAYALVEDKTTTTTTTSTTPKTTTTKEPVLDHLKVTVIAINATVPKMDRGLIGPNYADPYIELYVIEGSRHRWIGKSPYVKNTLNPNWNYMFRHEMELTPESLLLFELFDWDTFNTNEMIGKLYIKMSELIEAKQNGQIVKRKYGLGSVWFTVHWREVYRSVESNESE